MACAFVVLTTVSTVARAGDQAQNLEPVGPHEAILTTVGSKQVIAFYEPGSGQENKSLDLQCSANAEKLAVVHTDNLASFGIKIQQPEPPVKASASGF